MVVKGIIVGDGEEEVLVNVFILWAPDFLTAFVDDGVLMWVVGNGSGARQGSEEVGEELGFQGDGEQEVGEDRSRWGRGGDDSDWGFNNGQQEVFDGDIGKRDSFDDFFELKIDVRVLVFGGQGVLELRAYNVSLLGGDIGKDVEKVRWGDNNGGWGQGAMGIEA
jgi:hypothetical protein